MEPRVYSSATNIVHLPTPRHRAVPDVPEDVDFLMEHLNDPNFDYTSETHSISESSTEVYELERKKVSDTYSTRTSDFDARSGVESTRYSTASRTDAAFEYDELVYPHPLNPIFF
jgi:hypothetical protein